MLYCLFILIISIGCLPIRYAETDFYTNKYIEQLGELGCNIIVFEQNYFYYSERDSLFVGKGTWRLSDDKKFIILSGTLSNEHVVHDFPLSKQINLELKIKTRDRLIGDGIVFNRENGDHL